MLCLNSTKEKSLALSILCWFGVSFELRTCCVVWSKEYAAAFTLDKCAYVTQTMRKASTQRMNAFVKEIKTSSVQEPSVKNCKG